MKIKSNLTGCLLVLSLLTACSPSAEALAEQTAVAATTIAESWTPTPPPTETLIPTPEAALLPVLAAQLQSYLEGSNDIRQVNVSQLDRDMLQLDLTSAYISRDMQETLSYSILENFGMVLTLIPEEQLQTTFDTEKFIIRMAVHSSDNQYHYLSETDFSTLLRLNRKELDKDGWIEAAEGHFEF
jgi:hypothetical protein